MQINETRVYGVCIDELDDKLVDKLHTNSVSDDDFIELAEEQGYVWSLNGFQTQFNNDEICLPSEFYIRFINVVREV